MSLHLVNGFFEINNPTEDDIANAKHHAENGHTEAQYHLALLYDTGKGLPRNPREAEKWYKLAAAQGHAGAQYYLGRLYSSQNSGIRRDEKAAAQLFQAAAAQGHIEALSVVQGKLLHDAAEHNHPATAAESPAAVAVAQTVY